jgi:ribosome-associated heat shock protein Hsp15
VHNTGNSNDNKVRIDKYLWAIRIYKTRSIATKACIDGKVKYNNVNCKPAQIVSVGDVIHVKNEGIIIELLLKAT